MAPGIETVYIFLILAPILVALLLFVAWKIMNYVEKRKAAGPRQKPHPPVESNEKES